ncbi:MAG: nicotinate-nucleotide adenylyltransferase [Chlorobi bacterium]|nr:nicotinate-nucleotide adenylyltransferase [Chlorobiota bacterium]
MTKKEKIGLFFGSFNPIHIGHMILANFFAEHTDLDKVRLVVTPQNPHKQRQNLLEDYHRLYIARLAAEPYPKIEVSTVEFDLPQPNYTIITLSHLSDMEPGKEFVLLMGEDNLVSLPKWRNYEKILENYHIYVYPRKVPVDSPLKDHPRVFYLETAPIIEISASQIRKDILEGKNVRPLLPPEVYKYIREMNFYKS